VPTEFVQTDHPQKPLRRIRRHTNTKMISLSLPVTTIEKIDQRSQELGITRSRALSEALDILLEEGKL